MGVVFGYVSLPLLKESEEMFDDDTVGNAHVVNHIYMEWKDRFR